MRQIRFPRLRALSGTTLLLLIAAAATADSGRDESTKTFQKVGQIDFPCGTEQSVWDPATRKFYLSIPGCTA